MKKLSELGISPAPWTAKPVGREDGFSDHEVYDANCNYVLFDGVTGKNNCNMFAAAPQLYDALYDILRVAENRLPSHPTLDEVEAVMKAKAALAKASGESEVE